MCGIIGQPRTHFSRRFAIDFVGGSLKTLSREAKVEAAISASRGKLEIVSARPLDAINGWRALFDLVPDASTEPINLRLYLKLAGKPLSATWLYQYPPPPAAERKFQRGDAAPSRRTGISVLASGAAVTPSTRHAGA